MSNDFEPIDCKRANELLADILATPFDEDDDHLQFVMHRGPLSMPGDFQLDSNEVVIVNGDMAVAGCLADSFENEDDFSKLYVLGNLRARDMVCGSEVHVTGNLEVAHVLYANSFDQDTLHVGGTLSAKILIEEGHELEFGTLAVETLITDDATWREVKADAQVGDYGKTLKPHLVGKGGRFILSEALHKDLQEGLSVLR
ncbi:hypothetical protein OV207_18030 [Corallococcus sp. BB11-1]|uniref:hypothetical protein n=1 Tax=Corallococcus sp. BB11-1 TaxID=2996783 RepID=UPI00226D48B6|nr:hypothetical protein [Corallococcus sp. BB11-1]MCY1033358.1 hypothetical protein [Corallococcus sp. BB11-1]